MTLIVILNLALAIGIVATIVALHTRAIVADHRQHHGAARLWAWRPQRAQPAVAAPQHAPRARTSAPQRRRPAMVTD
ncbi:MAG TPA: hypothetical protein VKR21_15860 [Solirubrobacteraceae bacterium]|nr:hypothetical protein [Solirubrobacteraceae bacterium]